jgi:hypothetical protein
LALDSRKKAQTPMVRLTNSESSHAPAIDSTHSPHIAGSPESSLRAVDTSSTSAIGTETSARKGMAARPSAAYAKRG